MLQIDSHFQRLTGEWRVLQKFSSKPVLMFDCAVNLLPGCQVPLLACAGDDGSIQLFNFEISKGELSCVRTMKVPGHEDWIRALAFTVEGTNLNFIITLMSITVV
jgi:WD40 repeat protein